MAQGKAGWWIAGVCAVVVFISVGYGMGRRAGANPALAPTSSLAPAGSPMPAVQIEPIQPQQELAAISPSASPASATNGSHSPATAPAASATTAQGNTSAATAPAAPLPTEESARVREIQKALKAAGFDPGPLDGRMGGKTKAAVHDFQVANGLDADGKVGPKTWNKLEPFLKQQAKSND